MNALLVVVLLLLTTATAHAGAPKVAVFDFELLDTSLEGEIKGARSDEHARLLQISAQLRDDIRQSDRYDVMEMAALNVAAQGRNLQACGGCDVQMAQQIGADLVITGVVQKTSNLILNVSIYLRNAHTGALIVAMNADMRGNTDESWLRTIRYLTRNRLLAPSYGAPQPP